MNVNAINGISNNYKLNYKKQIKNNSLKPALAEKTISMTGRVFLDEYEKNFLDSLNSRQEELYDLLDSVSLDDGKTISNVVFNMFDNIREDKNLSLFHRTMGEDAENIIENGFDTSAINTTEYGPGFYFGTNEGGIQIYSGETLKAKYEGKTAGGVNLTKYNKINSDITNVLRKYLKLPVDFSNPKIMQEQDVLRRFVNEYVRQKIVGELGIDGAYANNFDGYFIVFNPNSIKSIEKYNI